MVVVAAIARDETECFLGASAVVTRMANNQEILEATACRAWLRHMICTYAELS
jgi:hypothetical protein